jgi:hypothetical protein
LQRAGGFGPSCRRCRQERACQRAEVLVFAAFFAPCSLRNAAYACAGLEVDAGGNHSGNVATIVHAIFKRSALFHAGLISVIAAAPVAETRRIDVEISRAVRITFPSPLCFVMKA